ncbi:MAG: hypothetical protein ACKVIK_16030 [Rhodospirillales bacterium]
MPKTKSIKRTINLPESPLEGLRKHRKGQAETLLRLRGTPERSEFRVRDMGRKPEKPEWFYQ